jgi:hypothetical protein
LTAGVKGIGLFFLVCLFLVEGILYAVLSGFLSLWSHQTALSLRMIGWGPGRIIGLFTGGILGASLAGGIGGIVGAIVFYFLGRWAGSKLSIIIGKYLERFFQLGPPRETTSSPAILRKKVLFFIFSISGPFIFFGCALMLSYYDLIFLPPL